MRILTPDEIRAAEAAANEAGLSYETMMRRAGEGCALLLQKRLEQNPEIVILAGRGKNGGDGFVCTGALKRLGFSVRVILAAGRPADPLAKKMLNEIEGTVEILNAETAIRAALDLVARANVIVDAVFGIGFRGRLPAGAAALIREANKTVALRVAIDLPSGVGEASEEPEPFRADETYAMLCFKREHVMKPAKYFCGKTRIVPIGFDPPAGAPAALTLEEAAKLLPPRPCDGHKGTFGNVLILGGSRGMPGAPILAANGALHAGAGLVTLAVPDPCLPAAQAHLCEPVFLPLPATADGQISRDAFPLLEAAIGRASAVVFGNGVGVGPAAEALTRFVLKTGGCPLILDADGINCAAKHKDIWKDVHRPVLITPHPGEMARLTGEAVPDTAAARTRTAAAFAASHGVFVLLKSENSAIAAPDGRLVVNPTGCAAMARGGSGDTLAGVIGALTAQGMNLFAAAALGAYAHGLAGEIAERRFSGYAATATRTAESLGDAFLSLQEEDRVDA